MFFHLCVGILGFFLGGIVLFSFRKHMSHVVRGGGGLVCFFYTISYNVVCRTGVYLKSHFFPIPK